MLQRCASKTKRQLARRDPDVRVQVWKHLDEGDETSFGPLGGGGPLARLLDRRSPDDAGQYARQIGDGECLPGSRPPDSARSGSFPVRR